MAKSTGKGRRRQVARRTKGRGAQRQMPASNRSLSWLRILILSSLTLVCGAGIYLGKDVSWGRYIANTQALFNRPIKHIVIEGEFKYLNERVLREQVAFQNRESFFGVDIGQVKKMLEQMPWVETVSIRRVWPDGINISVAEQKPIARWGREGFINQYGDIVNANGQTELASLPVLHGDELMSGEITRTYMEIANLFSVVGITMRGLRMDRARATTLYVNQNLELVLGRENILDKIENFIFVYQRSLVQRESEIAKIDMRYEKGLAVTWKTSENLVGHRVPVDKPQRQL